MNEFRKRKCAECGKPLGGTVAECFECGGESPSKSREDKNTDAYAWLTMLGVERQVIDRVADSRSESASRNDQSQTDREVAEEKA